MALAGEPIINEFMAADQNAFADEDGEFEDWVEIVNNGDAAIDLAGWHLTDNPSTLDKWTFPAKSLAVGEHLVVFASNKDRAVAGQQLHTNFRLDNDGEFLALVRPDGSVASQYTPTFPQQIDNTSYGIATEIQTIDLLQAVADAKVLVPSNGALGTSWTDETFNDASWQDAITGVGYAAEGPIGPQSGFLLRMVQNGTAPNTATNAGAIINGPGPFTFDQTQLVPLVNHGTGGGGVVANLPWPNGVLDNSTSDFVVKATATVTIPAGAWTIGFGSDEGGYLRFGSLNFNTTTHGESGTTTADDNEIRFEGTRALNVWTTGQITVPAGGITTTLEVVSFENTGSDALEIRIRPLHTSNSLFGFSGTLLSDGTQGWQVKSTAPTPAPPYGTLVQTSLQSQMYQQRTSAYLRVPIVLNQVPTLDTLKLRMKYDDAFVAYLNGVEVARSNVAVGMPAWNATATTNRPDADALTFHEFDISGAIDELIEGENILAIHGLNANTTANDQAFLILPELIGTDILGASLDYMSVATPGTINQPGFDGLGAGPTFSHSSGTFSTNFSLTLSTSNLGGQIRYTLDGSQPSATSTLYTGPIVVSNTAQVRARTFVPDFLPSPIVSHTFFKLEADVQNFSSNLPIVIIDTFGGAIDAATLRTSYMTIVEPGTDGRAAITDVPDTTTRSGIKWRGSSTQGSAKHQFRLETWGEGVDTVATPADRDLSLVGLPEESDWILFGNSDWDRTLMHNELMYQLSNEAGAYASRTKFVEVFFNSGGTVSQADYSGVYSIMESTKVGENRVDIDELAPGDETAPEVTGGYMIKIDRCDNGDTGFSAGGISLCWHDPVAADLTAAQEQYLINYVNQFGAALNGANFTNPTTGYAAYFDVDLSIDHHILNVMAMNVDALRLSTYIYKPRDGKLTFGPIWDFDRALGSRDGRDDNPQAWNGTGDGTPFFTYPWWGRMFQDPNFWQKWIDRWQELRESTLSTEHMFDVIDGFAEELVEAGPRNHTEWAWTPFPAEVAGLKSWLQTRAAWMDTRFTRMPNLSRGSGTVAQGTQVTLAGPAGTTIYYTLDGSDPRASGGGIAPGALVYSGTPITINDNTRVTARAKSATQIDGSTWSGPRIGNFLTDPNPLVVTEINFHPAPPTAAEIAAGFTLADDFEYIEVQNVRDRNLNLAGYKFTGGIEFTFGNLTLTPGQKAVVARNSAAFAARYGGGITVAGQYGNANPLLDTQLDNGGEPIELTGPFDNLVQEFSYADGWYDLVDGNGFSLVVVDPNGPPANWNTKAGWRPSDFRNGSPTSGDTGIAPADGSILISEILSNSNLPAGDRIELYNPTASPIDVRHWYVTDDATNLTKFQFASSTVVPAMGYRVVSKVELGPSFAISNLGGDLILQAANSSNAMIGFQASQDFDGAAVESTLGRHTNSVGDIDFAPLSTSTLGSGNSAPLVGSVVFNEFMYHPTEDTDPVNEDEYIELYNRTGASVPLYDPDNLANTWSISGIGDFAFPPGVTIPAGGYVLVTPVQPELFRLLYSVPAEVQIFQYDGGLDNDGETINLFRPGTPEAGGVPQILVDHIQYGETTPWPDLADGEGSSLSRFAVAAYGNEPENWLPSTTGGTPGRTNTYHDITPPTVPTSVATTLMGPTHVDVNWTASIDPQSAVLQYNVFRNGVLIGTSATASFSDMTATAGTPLVYEISAVNLDQAESARSTPTTPLTIMTIVSAAAPQEHSVRLIFSEPVVEADAEDIGNFSIDGGVRIVGATLAGDGRTVLLRTTSLAPATTYTVTAGDIFGTTGNEVAPNTESTFVLSGVLEAFTVRHVNKATGQVGSLAEADALLALPPGNAGISSEATVLAPILDYKDDDGSADAGRFPGSSLFPANRAGNDNDFAVRATATITVPPGQGGPWTFATGVIGPTTTLIPTGATWSYLDDGSDQGTAWRDRLFNDSSWDTGPGELGYGDGDEATSVLFGDDAANKFATTYFRNHFNLASTASIATLTLRVKRDDGVAVYLNGTEIVRDNLAVGAAFNTFAVAVATDDGAGFTTYNVPVNLLVAGDNVLAAEVHQANGSSGDLSFEAELIGGSEVPPVPPAGNMILPRGSVWKYLDNGSDQGTAWRATAFNDSAWASGPAELGYGDGGEATVIDCGPAAGNECNPGNPGVKYITSYFRKSINIPDASLYAGLTFLVRRDDAAVVYFNGTEVFKDTTLPPNPGYQQLASATLADDGNEYFAFTVNPALLVNGSNVIAVEVHQQAQSSSDVSFDFEAVGLGVQADDGVRLRIDGANTILADVGVSRINRFGTFDLTEGTHTLDLTFFERMGAAQLELFAAPGTHTAFSSAFRLVGDTASGGLVATSPGTPSNQAPFVVDVLAASSQWSSGYLAELEAAGLGAGGFSLARGADQLDPIAWTNVNQIKIAFSDDMSVQAGDLALAGVNIANYGLAPGGFNYNAATRTATWTFNQPFGNDKLRIDLSDAATDVGGAALDGEWTDSTSTASGNNSPGGDFRFRFNVLAGDVDGSGQTNRADLQANLVRQFTAPGQPLYSGLHDVDGNAAINILDWAAIRDRSGATLPAGEPSGSPVAPSPVAADAAFAVSARQRLPASNAPLRAARRASIASIDPTMASNDADATGVSASSVTRRMSRSAARVPAAPLHDQALADWSTE